ncbi:Ser/Thr protein kinase [Cryptosporidium canis]|nr:Ser/Thr protein kinase [Cryptosporidium canis]
MICEIGEKKEGSYVVKGAESYKKSTKISPSSSLSISRFHPNNVVNLEKSVHNNNNNNNHSSRNVHDSVLVYKEKSPRSSSTIKSIRMKQQHQYPQIYSSTSSIGTSKIPPSQSNNSYKEYSKVMNGLESMSITTNKNGSSDSRSKKCSIVNIKTSDSLVSSSSGSNNQKRLEIRRKYYVKVTPINTKYIAIVKTITNNTPLLLCFEHGKDRHPKEIINLKNSNIYKGVTEKGPCICIRPKNESKYKTIEIIEDDKRSTNNGKMESSIYYNINSKDKEMSNVLQTKISSNSVTMYEVECHSDFEMWCNFLTSIGISLCNFRSLFHTTKLIGEGSFAKVYKGKNVITGEDVVLKAVDKKKVKESNVYTEIEVLRKVHHPHIVHFIASFEEEDHVCLVLEFLGGGELFEWIAQKGAYSEDQAKIAMKRVLLALQWLHANNVVHRDLKTENLILENRNCPESLKIIDFGLAASLGSSAMKMRCGSPGYVAPEILEDKIYSTKVDVFSIGVVLYTLLGGSPPFPGSNMKEILKKNIQGNVQFTSSRWKNISSSVKDLIKWMMAKDPESRCTAAQAIYHPWFEKIQLSPGLMISSSSSSSSSNNNNNQAIVPSTDNNPVNITLSSCTAQNKKAINQDDYYSTCLSNLPNKISSRRISINNNTRFHSSSNHNKSTISISSLEYTDSQFSSSINSMKISPRSAIIPSSNQSNRKSSIHQNITTSNNNNNNRLGSNISNQNQSPSQIRSFCNSSNDNSMSEKLTEVEDEDAKQYTRKANLNQGKNEETSGCESLSNASRTIKDHENSSTSSKITKQPDCIMDSFGDSANFHSIYYAATIHEDNFSYERPIPMVGNIMANNASSNLTNTPNDGKHKHRNNYSSSSSSGISNHSKLQSSLSMKNSNKTNRSSSIKAVLQNVFSRFSSSSNSSNNNNNNGNHKSNQSGLASNNGKNYEIN